MFDLAGRSCSCFIVYYHQVKGEYVYLLVTAIIKHTFTLKQIKLMYKRTHTFSQMLRLIIYFLRKHIDIEIW